MDKIIFNLMRVIDALNTITVSGKTNLANLAGSIGLLEDIAAQLRQTENKNNEPEAQN